MYSNYSDPGETCEIEKRGEDSQWALVLGNVKLTSEEASSLEKEWWLLDQVILFFLTYLCRIKWSQYKDDIEIIGPSVSQMLKMCKNDDQIVEQLQPLNLMDRTLDLIPTMPEIKKAKGAIGVSSFSFQRKKFSPH